MKVKTRIFLLKNWRWITKEKLMRSVPDVDFKKQKSLNILLIKQNSAAFPHLRILWLCHKTSKHPPTILHCSSGGQLPHLSEAPTGRKSLTSPPSSAQVWGRSQDCHHARSCRGPRWGCELSSGLRREGSSSPKWSCCSSWAHQQSPVPQPWPLPPLAHRQ